jgi:hypothetical protein
MEGFDTMNDAPEKIWAGPDMDDKGNHWENGDWDCRKGLVSPFYIEYTRSDIAQARIEKLEAALRFYAIPHAYPNEGPWGANSTDFGGVANKVLKETQ